MKLCEREKERGNGKYISPETQEKKVKVIGRQISI